MKKKRLKIATVVAAELPFPIPKDFPRPYAPLQVALDIAEGLSKKGHQLTFIGPKGSQSKKFRVIRGDFTALYKNKIFDLPHIRTIEREKIFNLFDQYLVSLLFKENLKKKFDIIHIHPVDRALPLAFLFETPVVYTLHDPVYRWRKEIFKLYQTKNQYFVSISNFQQKAAPDLNWAATIYNGINLKLFPFNPKAKNQFLFLGRLLEKKGPQTSVQAAIRAKEKLIIAGGPNKGNLWDKKIKPYLRRKNISYVGSIPYQKTYKYYGQSKALLCPIQWEEPFGLTFIEAMACGTPVIAFDRGSAREVIEDGKTGFVVPPFAKDKKPNLDGFVKAIRKIDRIKREDCRKRVEERFTVERMVADYENLFYKILEDKRSHS